MNPNWLNDIPLQKDVMILPNGNVDPVFHCEFGWAWFDETWTEAYGYFDTRDEAEVSVAEYAKEFLR